MTSSVSNAQDPQPRRALWLALLGAGLSALLLAPAMAGPLTLRFGPEGQEPQDPPNAARIGALEDHDIVLLHATLPFTRNAGFFVKTTDGARQVMKSCEYGEITALAEVMLPIADNHLLATVKIGAPPAHAANMAFCEYSSDALLADAAFPAQLVVRGCFLTLSFEIPTARELVFTPLPASACGLHR